MFACFLTPIPPVVPGTVLIHYAVRTPPSRVFSPVKTGHILN